MAPGRAARPAADRHARASATSTATCSRTSAASPSSTPACPGRRPCQQLVGAGSPAPASRCSGCTPSSSPTATPTTSAGPAGSAARPAPRSSPTSGSALIWDRTEPPDLDVEDVADAPSSPPRGDARGTRRRGVARATASRSSGGCGCGAASLAPRLFKTPVPSVRLADAEVIRLAGREWVGLHTPGHTDDHLCLFDPTEGVMLSGDHVLPTITPHIGGFDPQRRSAARLLRVARQGRRLRAGRHDRAACPRPPVRRPRRAGQGDPGAPRRASRPAAPHDRGPRSPGRRAGAVDAPVLAAGPGPDGRQRDVRPPRAPPPRRRARAPRAGPRLRVRDSRADASDFLVSGASRGDSCGRGHQALRPLQRRPRLLQRHVLLRRAGRHRPLQGDLLALRRRASSASPAPSSARSRGASGAARSSSRARSSPRSVAAAARPCTRAHRSSSPRSPTSRDPSRRRRRCASRDAAWRRLSTGVNPLDGGRPRRSSMVVPRPRAVPPTHPHPGATTR